jgi:predicted porin
MANRTELDKLIEAALADNKLTTKEMEVLVKKAKQLGIDEDEFLIELDAKKYKAKLKQRGNTKNSRKKLILISTSAIIIFASLSFILFTPNKKERFETALSKYDFQKAYSLLGKFDDWNGDNNRMSEKSLQTQQLIKIAVPYYLKNNQPQAAIDALSEYHFEYTLIPVGGFLNSKSQQRQFYNGEAQFYNSLWFDIAYYLVKNGQVIEAKDIVNLKLVPFSDDSNSPSFEPIQELRNNFQVLLDGLPE